MGMDSSTIQDPPTEASESTELVEYPPVTCSRIKLRDGRVLAYTERGVPKNRSNYKIIIVHGFGSSKEMSFPVSRVRRFNFNPFLIDPFFFLFEFGAILIVELLVLCVFWGEKKRSKLCVQGRLFALRIARTRW